MASAWAILACYPGGVDPARAWANYEHGYSNYNKQQAEPLGLGKSEADGWVDAPEFDDEPHRSGKNKVKPRQSARR